MGFVQADPICAPARAQDLILRHQVKSYHAGDLERRYATLDIEEDCFITYGFVTRSLRCTTAGCCVWRGVRRASASTPHTSTYCHLMQAGMLALPCSRQPLQPSAVRGSMRWSM
jgi:hypothetical protein